MTLKSNLFILFILGFSFNISAQSERKITRKGNSQYETGNFVEAEVNYKKAIEKNADLLEAEFNLGDALMKQERFEEALESFEKVSNTSENLTLKAKALHNKGNALLSQQDLEGALESYKEALRINPKDNATRYNYAFVKNQLEQQQEQEQKEENKDDNKEDQEQKEDNKDKDDQKNENSENQDQEKTDKKEEQNEEGQSQEDESKQDQKDKGQTDGEDSNEEKNGEKPQPKENKLSPEEAQRLLEALKQEENKVQEKMKKHKIKGAKVKIEKDW